MVIFALIGKSGTGKSHQALNLCQKHDIDSIIDDGLFIHENRVISGVSAKKQSTTVGAIKTALFISDEQMKNVSESIKHISPKKMLILGTSDRMVDKIAARLQVGMIDKRVYIESITTEKERLIANKQRNIFGKHVIPVPTLQLKRDFSGYFLDTIKGFIDGSAKNRGEYNERTVVRPTFSYIGEFFISESAIEEMVRIIASKTPGIGKVFRTHQTISNDNFSIKVVVNLLPGHRGWKSSKKFQLELKERLEKITAFNIVDVTITIKGIDKSH